MKRGEIWWAELGHPSGKRPVVLLSRNDAYFVRSLIVIAPVTTHIRHINSEVPLGTEDGLPKECVINLDTITTIPKDCLREFVAALTPEKMKQLDQATRFALGMD
jgi:mRNA interferase MazF